MAITEVPILTCPKCGGKMRFMICSKCGKIKASDFPKNNGDIKI